MRAKVTHWRGPYGRKLGVWEHYKNEVVHYPNWPNRVPAVTQNRPYGFRLWIKYFRTYGYKQMKRENMNYFVDVGL